MHLFNFLNRQVRALLFIAFLGLSTISCNAQQNDPWTKAQLKEPAALAQELKLPADQHPVVIDVGPSGRIKGSLYAGPTEDKEGMDKLKALLQPLSKDKEVVIYCGCCPFNKCPNVRPAFKMLQDMEFQKPRLLNLTHNLKADWIDKGFPLEDE